MAKGLKLNVALGKRQIILAGGYSTYIYIFSGRNIFGGVVVTCWLSPPKHRYTLYQFSKLMLFHVIYFSPNLAVLKSSIRNIN